MSSAGDDGLAGNPEKGCAMMVSRSGRYSEGHNASQPACRRPEQPFLSFTHKITLTKLPTKPCNRPNNKNNNTKNLLHRALSRLCGLTQGQLALVFGRWSIRAFAGRIHVN